MFKRKTHPIIDLFKVGCRELAFVKPTLNKYIKAIGFIKNRVFLLFLPKLHSDEQEFLSLHIPSNPINNYP